MKTLKKPLVYILAILVILQCYSLLSMIIPNWLLYGGIIVVELLLLCVDRKLLVNSRFIFVAATFAILVPILLTSTYYRNFEFICCIYVVFILSIIYFGDKSRILIFFEAYTNIVFIICSMSLFFFFFGSLLSVIKPTGFYPYTDIGWGTNNYYDYYHLYCEGQSVVALGYSGVRNIALFIEGPVLAYVVSFALFYELFLRISSFRTNVMVVFIITIITSFSTTGLIVLIILLYLKFYEFFKTRRILKLLVIPIIVCIAAYGSYYVTVDKMVSNVYSAHARTDDIVASLKTFLSDPMNGVGYQNMEGIDPYRQFRRLNAGLSTGVGAIFAYGGILWGVWYIIPLVISAKKSITSRTLHPKCIFVFLGFFLLLLTVVQSRVLCTVVLAVSWVFSLDEPRYR